MKPERKEALEVLKKYNHEPFHIRHALTVEGVMRYFARELGYADEEELWGICGLLHDLDFEMYPDEHCIKEEQIMRSLGYDERVIHAAVSHGWGLSADVEPVHEMEKVLFATDELTGLIGACAKVHPSGDVKDLSVKSVRKKFKTPAFAAGCSRDVIMKGAGMLGWDIDTLIERTLKAMQSFDLPAEV